MALAFVALGCSLALYRTVAAPPPQAATAKLDVPTVPTAPAEPLFDVALLHATYPMGAVVTFSPTDLPFGPAAQVSRRAVPLTQAAAPQRPPVQRPAQSARLPAPDATPGSPQDRNPSLAALARRSKIASVTIADDPFKKLFGNPDTGPALAYAAPDGGVFNDGRSLAPGKLPPNDGLTAIYDITARAVYLPDGSKLEAHSGLGPRMDDPRFVHVKMHGATPPHVYDLVPREALFHGVQALRLIPVGGEGAIFGRTGLLTHSYLLGPNGDSNGCISFKDYDAFLRAYQNGKVKRMVVVASLG